MGRLIVNIVDIIIIGCSLRRLFPPLWVLFPEFRVEEQIVVPSYNDLVLVWLFRQPCELSLDLGERTPFTEISGVKKEITRWDGWMRAMCV